MRKQRHVSVEIPKGAVVQDGEVFVALPASQQIATTPANQRKQIRPYVDGSMVVYDRGLEPSSVHQSALLAIERRSKYQC